MRLAWRTGPRGRGEGDLTYAGVLAGRARVPLGAEALLHAEGSPRGDWRTLSRDFQGHLTQPEGRETISGEAAQPREPEAAIIE